MKQTAIKQTQLPPGWSPERIGRVLAHYESQSEEEAMAEDEAAFGPPDGTVMKIPLALVPAVRALIAKYEAAHDSTGS
uniref:Uncharacterized protein n=1 Tax=Candidatus Kentrum sp. TUN TaxID=2126343 RepID=A0A450ZCC6_9GAMM|nr:MAG: hypothetical protein BECKTUN1418D_GA0071000_10087 [Candidatus Kentron sp. TUN]VFK57253.1 MAG: hypothetical protein BECKTUN1418F_GA0071002_11107 [Candidatus Kentron sp. TUN]VFK65370.1 MAG: hypothetical protein BECKTUN1418E_GA0071001_11067 [Candidatus Kentron sp. TUN]